MLTLAALPLMVPRQLCHPARPPTRLPPETYLSRTRRRKSSAAVIRRAETALPVHVACAATMTQVGLKGFCTQCNRSVERRVLGKIRCLQATPDLQYSLID